MGQTEKRRRGLEFLCELTPTVLLEVLDLPFKEVMDPLEEIGHVPTALRCVYQGESDLRVSVDAGQDIPLGAHAVPDNGIGP